MGGTLLLFGYDQLPVILAAEAAVKPFGATLQVVGPRSCGRQGRVRPRTRRR